MEDGEDYQKQEDQPKEEVKFPPLNDQQILEAQFKIDLLHKMAKTPYYKSFPYFCFCLRLCAKSDEESKEERDSKRQEFYEKKEEAKSQGKQARKNARMLLELYDEKIKADEEMENDLKQVGGDAFMLLGAGLMAYRKMLASLTACFIIMGALMYPVLNQYRDGNGLDHFQGVTNMQKYTIANLGYSTVQCKSTNMMTNKLFLQCPYGKISSILPGGIGLNGFDQTKRIQNKRGNAISQTNACVVNDKKFGNQGCTDLIDMTVFEYYFNLNCKGKNDCMWHSSQLDELFKQSKKNKQAESSCYENPRSMLFMQYACEIDDIDRAWKYDALSLVSCICMFVAFLFSQLIYFLQQTSKLDNLKYDVKTVTASDFTVEYEITQDMYDDFIDNVYTPIYSKQQEVINGQPTGNLYSRGLALKAYVAKEVQQLLTESIQATRNDILAFEAKHGKTNKAKKMLEELSELSDVKIISIYFAYYNHQLINLLTERGAAITELRFEDGGFPFYAKSMENIDNQITDLLHNDEAYDRISRPVTAFLTFESDDGRNEALSFSKESAFNSTRNVAENLRDRTIMNATPVFTQATEPTNIIWQNRYIHGINYGARVTVIAIISVFMLVLAFFVVFTFKKSQIAISAKWPAINVHSMEKNYGSELKDLAGLEYDLYKKTDGQAPMQGFLEAYCKVEEKKIGPVKATDLEVTYKNDKGKSVTNKICDVYITESIKTTLENNAIKYLIIIINYVIRTVVSLIMAYCGCDTESIKLQFVTNVVFVCQFFNTGVLPMMTTANMEGQLPQGLVNALNLKGQDSDFNALWFTNIGSTIVGAMQVNIVMPVALEFVYYGMRLLKRIKDKAGLNPLEGPKTKCTTIQQYVNIYAGSLYLMQFKYSAILTIIYITFMFGCGMPMLFPLAAAAFFVLYLLETFTLHYIHQTPPAYDVKLNDACLAKLQFAPLLLLGFGYWMTTNPMLLQNYKTLQPLEFSNSAFMNQHYWTDYVSPACIGTAGPGGAMLGLFYAYALYLMFRGPIRWMEKACGCKLNRASQIDNIEIDEEIPVYQKCLDDDDRNWTLKEEELSREYGIQTMMDSEYDAIKNNDLVNPDKHLQGTHTYDILRNILYITAFQYVAYSVPFREDFIIDIDDDDTNNAAQSDLVRIALNAAFLEKDELQALEFNTAACERLKNLRKQSKQNNMV